MTENDQHLKLHYNIKLKLTLDAPTDFVGITRTKVPIMLQKWICTVLIRIEDAIALGTGMNEPKNLKNMHSIMWEKLAFDRTSELWLGEMVLIAL